MAFFSFVKWTCHHLRWNFLYWEQARSMLDTTAEINLLHMFLEIARLNYIKLFIMWSGWAAFLNRWVSSQVASCPPARLGSAHAPPPFSIRLQLGGVMRCQDGHIRRHGTELQNFLKRRVHPSSCMISGRVRLKWMQHRCSLFVLRQIWQRRSWDLLEQVQQHQCRWLIVLRLLFMLRFTVLMSASDFSLRRADGGRDWSGFWFFFFCTAETHLQNLGCSFRWKCKITSRGLWGLICF